MKNVFFILSLVFVCSLTTSSSTVEKAQGEKVTICHVPPGNPANTHEITVSVNAIPAHLAHGDLIGGCGN